jgi:hypothetical protein
VRPVTSLLRRCIRRYLTVVRVAGTSLSVTVHRCCITVRSLIACWCAAVHVTLLTSLLRRCCNHCCIAPVLITGTSLYVAPNVSTVRHWTIAQYVADASVRHWYVTVRRCAAVFVITVARLVMRPEWASITRGPPSHCSRSVGRASGTHH